MRLRCDAFGETAAAARAPAAAAAATVRSSGQRGGGDLEVGRMLGGHWLWHEVCTSLSGRTRNGARLTELDESAQ